MSRPLRYIAQADGGSRGNPGPAGYGAVIKDAADDLVLAERSESIGTATNNVAEYHGLIAALEAALELGITELDVQLDSKLVVEQMRGTWKIKNAQLQPLAIRARRLADRFGRVEFSWIPRAENAHADRLANEAMDAAKKGAPARTSAGAAGAGAVDAGVAAETADDSATRPRAGQPDPVADEAPGPPYLLTDRLFATPAGLSLVMLRHGETDQSIDRRFAGRTDLPLTDRGRAQARAAADWVATAHGRFERVVSSPMRRARQTAAQVAARLHLDVEVDDGLREIDFGDWEGMTFGEARRAGGEAFVQWFGSHDIAPPGGESQAACLLRVAEVRSRLLAEVGRGRVLVVTHVTPIKALIAEALGSPAAASRINLDVCSLSRIDYTPQRTAVRLVNEVSHLGGL